MSSTILSAVSKIALILSFLKDKKKTIKALKKALKSFENILPQFLAIIVIVAINIAFLDQDQISKAIGEDSGIIGVFGAAIAGRITLIAGFIAFPATAD
ncbi:MAG: hypothetical protein PQJ61_04360 [Spirochaetales bacterium]|uniref:Uncharacterized protein n=1 Tax=Candidatus Thalassospirochaeta sargassi TaxID=3119039 RepID=A0AAJ1MN38_9SPIO|nr:hypothetical protein [Spirochaetales bacterium]